MENKNNAHLVYCVMGLLTKSKPKLNTRGWPEDLVSFPSIKYKMVACIGL